MISWKNILNVVEMPSYRVQRKIDYTNLMPGDVYPAFRVFIFGQEFVLMGVNFMKPEYFSWSCMMGDLDRVSV